MSNQLKQQLWWWIGDPYPPSYVSYVLALTWGLLAFYSYYKSGFSSRVIFYVFISGIRFGLAAISHEGS